ncbi:MAG: polysaccharide pyruvyl transferase family protein [Methanobacterium sp.]|uniref:polysaccharide pyruvyl transferase family protein n=1 Tax=Methanobacterium sp. TaxID=2164 RepID=UPI003C735825
MKEYAPQFLFEFTALSRHPNIKYEKAYGIKFVKNLEYDSEEESKNKSFKGLNYGDNKEDLVRVEDQIKNCNILVLGAGNIFHDKTIDIFRGPIPLFALYVFLAKLYHKKVMLYGTSVTPLKTSLGKTLTRYIVENSDIVTLRDELSKIELQKILTEPKKIIVFPDSTLGAVKPDEYTVNNFLKREKIPRGRRYIGLALRDLRVVLSDDDTEIIWNQIVNTLNKLKNEFEFVFVPQVTYKWDDDRIIANKLSKRLDKDVKFHIIKKWDDPKELIGLYSCFDLTLSIRLHGTIFSCIAGTPVIAINYMPKVESFMESMELKEYLINIKSIKNDYLLKLINKLLEDKEVSTKIKNKINEKKELTNHYHKLAVSLLDE